MQGDFYELVRKWYNSMYNKKEANMKVQKILVKIMCALCAIGIAIAYFRENHYAIAAWLVALFMSFSCHSMLAMMEAMGEDIKFWKRNFVNAQERYARSIPPPEIDPPKSNEDASEKEAEGKDGGC